VDTLGLEISNPRILAKVYLGETGIALPIIGNNVRSGIRLPTNDIGVIEFKK
jgi:hypothetical protein